MKMIDGFNEYLECIKADYVKWHGDNPSEIQKAMAQEFCDSLSYEVGRSYIKVITGRAGSGRSVHSFVCLRDMGKFTKGDILKAAGWSAPAKNFARGNTMARTFQNIRWTGAM
jgi:ABC-type branched-subunit amino acid transport system ATPase component